jgi:sec-independent protein translocase protein TatA
VGHRVARRPFEEQRLMLGSLGAPELILILVIAVVVFGPSKLPEVGSGLGKAIGEFRKAMRAEPEPGPADDPTRLPRR